MSPDSPSRLSDPERLSALRDLGILEKDEDSTFGGLTKLASRLLHAPVALVSIVDDANSIS